MQSAHQCGALNAITDVDGIRVGHASLQDAHTGVTVVMPHSSDAERVLFCWGKHIVGSPGELTGLAVIEDFGRLGSPVFMTSLASIGRIYDGALTYAFSKSKGLPLGGGWPPLVMGFDDGVLSDPRRRALTAQHALQAIASARPGPVAQGNVGAGMGAVSFGFKGGIGTASRRVGGAHVGVLTLASHGRRGDLVVGAAPVGELLSDPPPLDNEEPAVLSVVATDAPLGPRRLDRLSESVAGGWTRLGSMRNNGVALAFSTREAPQGSEARYSSAQASGLYDAASEAAAESVLSALLHADTLHGRLGRRAYGLSAEALQKALST